MSTKILGILAIFAAFVFLGNGCVGNNGSQEQPAADELSKLQLDNLAPTGQMTLSAEVLGANTVRFNWTAPAGVGAIDGFRILSSASPGPTLPRAYWDWIAGNKREATLSDVKSGKRYFRICEWKKTECGAYSNEVHLLVP